MRYALNYFQLGRPTQTLWAILPAIVLALAGPDRRVVDRAVPITYTLTLVAKTGDTIGGKILTGFKLPSLGPNAPAINATGSVAFYATYSQGNFAGEGIFTPTSLVLKTGDGIGLVAPGRKGSPNRSLALAIAGWRRPSRYRR